ncbi:MAG: glycosyltransferase [Helicobacter sp.]|nr:glycosyltransferase [Helicobacter sp.]
MNKKRLCILLYSLGSGGAERIVSILLESLKNECEITLILLEDICHYEIPQNIKKVILGQNSINESGILKLLKIPLLAFKLRQIIKNYDISLSLMTRPNYINILAGILCKNLKNRPKILISERSYPSLQYGYKNLNSKINRFLIKALYNKADKISANSPDNLNDLIKNFGVDSTKTTLLLNLFDLEKIRALSKEDSALKDRILSAKGQGKFIFFSIGRLDVGKNHSLLIKAMSKFKDKAELFIIGDGELKATLEAEINALGLKNCVHLVGRLKNPFSPLSVSDCFLFASNHEGFPNVLVESLALGILAISTDCAPKEILAPYKNLDNSQNKLAKGGILVPLNSLKEMQEAMGFIIKNPRFFDKEIIFKQAQKFSLTSQLHTYKEWIFR